MANEVLIEAPAFCRPTRPPIWLAWKMSLLLPLVTLPEAKELVIVPKLKPTNPPAPAPVPSETLTSPLANEKNVPLIVVPPEPLMAPLLVPTNPPTNVNAPPLTFALEDEFTIVPIWFCPTSPFCPIRPPAITPWSPVAAVTVLLPVTFTLLTVPALVPASTPTNWPSPVAFGFAATVALLKLRFFTTPPAPIAVNMPTPMPKLTGFTGATCRLAMV